MAGSISYQFAQERLLWPDCPQFPHLRLFFAGGGRVEDCGLPVLGVESEASWQSFEEPAGLEHEGNGQVLSLLSKQNALIFS